MPPKNPDDKVNRAPDTGSVFPSTRWTLILAAKADTPAGRVALEELCECYWYPLYGYFRRQGFGPSDASDCVQELFSKLLHRNFLAGLSSVKGRFRSFLIASAQHLLADGGRRANAQKRQPEGGIVSFDAEEAEARYSHEPSGGLTPDEIFERKWAMAVLGAALKRGEAEWKDAGKDELFKALEPTLQGDKSISYGEIGSRLGMSEAAVKTTVFRLRRRVQELLREEVAKTVRTSEELDEEMNYLGRVLSS